MNITQKKKLLSRMRRLLKEYGNEREEMGYSITEDAITESEQVAKEKRDELIDLWKRILEL